jgi:hypothetical protein
LPRNKVTAEANPTSTNFLQHSERIKESIDKLDYAFRLLGARLWFYIEHVDGGESTWLGPPDVIERIGPAQYTYYHWTRRREWNCMPSWYIQAWHDDVSPPLRSRQPNLDAWTATFPRDEVAKIVRNKKKKQQA